MTFQNPAMLVWLIPLGGAILLLYLLKMKRRDLKVPATFLWPEHVEEIRANTLFQKLKPSWLLFLQLLALLLVVSALAKPQTSQKGLAGEVTVFVIDVSAGMAATDVQPNRLEEAKRIALEEVRSARPTDRIAIIEAGPTPRVIASLSNDPAKEALALDALKVTDSEAEVGDAMRLAAALVGSIEGSRIVLLSDGDFTKITNFSRGKAAVVYRPIGNRDDNLAISALGTTLTSSGRQLYCAVKNHGSRPIGGTLSIYADGKIIDSRHTPDIGGTGQWGLTVAAPAGAQIFEAKLDASDFLASDNYAVTVADPNQSLHVLLVTKGDLFLERALSLDPRVTLDEATEVPLAEQSGSGAGTYDVVVFDGIPEQPVKARGVLTFGAAGPSSPVDATGSATKTKFESKSNDALLASVDLSSVFIDRLQTVRPTSAGEVIAKTSAGPLVVTAHDQAKRQIYVAFQPLDSDFPLQVGFPIFVANSLDFLTGGASNGALAVRAGQTFTLPITGDATLTAPDGSTSHLKANGSVLTVREIKKVGAYVLEAGGRKQRIYASLRSERASSIRPEKNIELGGGEVKASRSPIRYSDFWRPILLLAMFVLAAEWWLFARKS